MCITTSKYGSKKLNYLSLFVNKIQESQVT